MLTERECVVVTGAAGSLGEHICAELKDRYFLILIDKKLSGFIQELEQENRAIFFNINICDYAQISNLQSKLKEFNIRGLIFAAGILESRSFKDSSLEDWESMMQVNLTANYVLSRQLYPVLKGKDGGHIIFISSVLSKVAGYDMMAYGVSKAGLNHLARNLALELMDDNIYVNCICPGFIDTSMLKKVKQGSDYNMKWIYMLGGLKNYCIRMEDIAGLISFLINQQSITGETIVIDNGYSIR